MIDGRCQSRRHRHCLSNFRDVLARESALSGFRLQLWVVETQGEESGDYGGGAGTEAKENGGRRRVVAGRRLQATVPFEFKTDV